MALFVLVLTTLLTIVYTNEDKYANFVEDRLIVHTKALEHLIKVVENNEELTRRLVEKLGKSVEDPTLPENIEVKKAETSTNKPEELDIENPVVKFGNSFRRFGSLVTDVVADEIQNIPEAPAYVESDEHRRMNVPYRHVNLGLLRSSPRAYPPNGEIKPRVCHMLCACTCP